MRGVLCWLLALLFGQRVAGTELTIDPVPTTVSMGYFHVVKGYLVYTNSGPAPMGDYVTAFWRYQHSLRIGTAQLFHPVILWKQEPEGWVHFNRVDFEAQRMECTTNLPLAPSAKAMLDALGCIWDIS